MGNGSTKHGDAIGDKLREEFARNQEARERARLKLESLPDDDDLEVTDTQRVQVVLGNEKLPTAAKGIAGILAVFPREHRWAAFIILAVLILTLSGLGGLKLLEWFSR
jgi:hypothetical protein